MARSLGRIHRLHIVIVIDSRIQRLYPDQAVTATGSQTPGLGRLASIRDEGDGSCERAGPSFRGEDVATVH